MMHILIPEVTNRLTYILDFLLVELSGLPYQLHTDVDQFVDAQGPKLNYTNTSVNGVRKIYNAGLLFETKVIEKEILVQNLETEVVIFCSEQPDEYILPFDPFSASFFMISRYEEYSVNNRDELGRFRAENSIAYKNGFLDKAVVNRWSMLLNRTLIKEFPELTIKVPTFSYLPSFDIDNAYAYKGKNVVRSLGGLMRDLLSGNFTEVKTRLGVLFLHKKDPYDSFDFIKEIHLTKGLKPIIFWLLGDYAKYDKNLPFNHSLMRKLIYDARDYSFQGIHPSVASSTKGTLTEEKKRLEEILGSQIVKSRMHYLRFTFPETFQRLVEAGIQSDYSLGYSEYSGFRAGVANPFQFFDLSTNTCADLTLHPFHLMDATFMYHNQKNKEEVLEEMKGIVDEVKFVNGQLVTVFHNECLGDSTKWNDWKDIYLELLDYIKQ